MSSDKEPAGDDLHERQPPPNDPSGMTGSWGYEKDLYHSFVRRGAIMYR